MTEKLYKIVGILVIVPAEVDTQEFARRALASHKLPWAAKHEQPRNKVDTEASWKDITDKPITIEETNESATQVSDK